MSDHPAERMKAMPVIERNISLHVPAEMAFRYLSEPTHLPELCPSLIEVNDLQQHSPGSVQFTWLFKMSGVRFEGEAEVKHTHHNQQVDIHFWGGIRGNLMWRLQPSDEGILLETTVDYTLPTPLLKKHTEDEILRQNEYAIESMLTGLYDLLQAPVEVPLDQP
jgi:uncharacterized membrane protein